MLVRLAWGQPNMDSVSECTSTIKIPTFHKIQFESDEFAAFIQQRLPQEENATVIPSVTTKVVKEECVYSCDTLDSPEGLFINLKTSQAAGADVLLADSAVTDCRLYLRLQQVWKLPEEDLTKEGSNDPVKLGIGVEGGFPSDSFPLSTAYRLGLCYVEKDSTVWLLPLHSEDTDVSKDDSRLEFLNNLGLPPKIVTAIRCIFVHSRSPGSATAPSWEEHIVESPYAITLNQTPNPPRIGPEGWKCAECGNVKNVWLHLADGYIGCGRKLYGVADSGCADGKEGAAVRHYEAFPEQCPLAVKLGTLTPSSADVFSYAEDAMVIDPLLPQHLQHFGINIQQTTKTEKSLTEMEVDYNKNYNWRRVCEAGVDLKPLWGAGHVGLHNYGNTCYMNAILQMFARISELCDALKPMKLIKELLTIPSGQRQSYKPAEDVVLQLGKTVNALMDELFVLQRQRRLDQLTTAERQAYELEFPNEVIFPGLFREVSTKQHPEFSTSRQQDAEEYLRYLIDTLSVALKGHLLPGVRSKSSLMRYLFGFEVEEQLRSLTAPRRVRLTNVDEVILSLPMNMMTVQSVEGTEAFKRPRVDVVDSQPPVSNSAAVPPSEHFSFQDCFETWMAGETVTLRVSHKNKPMLVEAQKTRRVKRFPRYLLIQLRRFYLAEDWTAKKIEAQLLMPEVLDLAPFKATGLAEDEEVWEDEDENPGLAGAVDRTVEQCSVAAEADAAKGTIDSVESMGFSIHAARKAVSALGSAATVEECVEWIIAHLDSPTLNTPPSLEVEDRTPVCGSSDQVTSPLLESMGFSPLHIQVALQMCNGDEPQALEWLMTTGASLTEDELQQNLQIDSAPKTSQTLDIYTADESPESGVYRLKGFCCHMGANANSGHYTYYARETDPASGTARWVLFNDRKVAETPTPPFDFGYVYIYQQCSSSSAV